MSYVFISYKREDGDRVRAIHTALKDAGLQVWWDQDIPGGEGWRVRIRTQLESAKCVVVVWSHASTGPEGEFVIAEAERARRLGSLLQVRIDEVTLPLPFGERQALDLIGWTGAASDKMFQNVIDAARAKLEGAPAPPPRPFRYRRAIPWVALFTVLTLTITILLNLCRIQNLFAGADETWTTEERRQILAVRSSLDPFPNEEAARADALARAQKDAEQACVGFTLGEFRLQSARPSLDKEWRCVQRQGGYACGFDGHAICQVSVRHQVNACP